jgi:ribonuclease E
MAGLVVIDFIDMEYGSNVRKVEKAMKDALRNDRARIQVGRISGFGLMEMSRQRLRTGVLEATTRSCPHCDGTGLVRTASSAGLSALRLIEDEAAKGKGTVITLYASTEAAVYLLNAKRADLAEIEDRYGVTVEVLPEGEDEGAKMRVTSTGPRPTTTPKFAPLVEEEDDLLPEDEEEFDEDEEFESREDRSEGEGRGKRRRRRRGGRGRSREDGDGREERDEEAAEDDGEERESAARADDDGEAGERPKKRRRRGGRRRRGRGDGEAGGETAGFEGAEAGEAIAEHVAEELVADAESAEPAVEAEAPTKPKRSRRKKADEPAAEEPVAEAPAAEQPVAEEVVEEAPAPKPRSRRKKAVPSEAEAVPTESEAPLAEAPVEAAKPKRSRRKKAEEPAEAEATAEPIAANDANGSEAEAGGDADDAPRRSGWWQRTFGN